jgi:hypothetical protein
MATLEGEGARHVAKPPTCGDPQAELCVLTNEEGFIEEADVVENRAANDNRGQNDRPVVHEVIAKLVGTFGVESAHRDDPAVRRVIAGKIDEVAVDEANVRAASERGQLALKLLRRPEVVSIKDGDELAARFAHRAISRGRSPEPRGLDDLQFVDLAIQPLQDDP